MGNVSRDYPESAGIPVTQRGRSSWSSRNLCRGTGRR